MVATQEGLVRGTKQTLVMRQLTMRQIARVKWLLSVGCFEEPYLNLVGRSNAKHQILFGVT